MNFHSNKKIKILVIQQKMVGDVLTCTVLFEILKKHIPNSQLDYLINSTTSPVVLNNPFIDNLILFDEDSGKKLSYLRQLGKKIQREEYDIVIDPYSKLSSNLLTYYSKAPVRISFKKWYTDFLYTKTYRRKKKANTIAGIAIEDRIALIENLIKEKISLVQPKIYLSDKEIEEAKKILVQQNINSKNPLLMISILGSNSLKTYPSNYMAQLLDWLSDLIPNAQVLFNYIPSQKEKAKEIFEKCNAKTQKQIRLDIYGKSLREFIAICHHCDAVIGNEGGAINIGKALGKKTFSVFSPWIRKEAWNIFEDGVDTDSVHLKDFIPEIYTEREPKELKKQATELYQKLKPELFKEKYLTFLKRLKNEE